MRRTFLVFLSAALLCGIARAQDLKQIEEAYLEIVRKVRPSVVAVTVMKSTTNQEGNRRVNRVSSTQFSGVVVSDEGHIATIAMAVKGANVVYVETLEGTRHRAQVVGVDERANVGIVQVTGAGKLKAQPVEFGDSGKLEVGSLTVVVGCPSGLKHSVVYGNVSGLGRTLVSARTYYTDMIQLSNPVSHSDPGGLVASSEGKLVGMVSPAFIKTPSFRRVEELIDALNRKMEEMQERLEKVKQEEKQPDQRQPRIPPKKTRDKMIRPELPPDLYDPALSQGINFAIPGNLVKEVCDRIIKGKKQPWVGVLVRVLTPVEKEQYGLKSGLHVLQVIPESPADKGGLKDLDVIVRFDGVLLDNVEGFRDAILGSSVNDEITLKIFRKKQELDVKLKLGERK